jgi:ceramide glucosyltransferase
VTAFAAWVALVWWVCALALLALSFIAAVVFPWSLRRAPVVASTPPLTAIVPVKAVDAGFDAAQASLLQQDYGEFETIIASRESASPALSAAGSVLARFDERPSRVIVAAADKAASPKLDNLWTSVEQAQHDLLFTKDSNVRLSPGDLEGFVRCMGPGVGLVSAMTVLVEPGSPAAWVEASVINGHYARLLFLGRALGLGFGLGKIMLFRRSDLERAGGLESIAWALGEDSALSGALIGLGLRTVLSDRLTYQEAGDRSWRDLWNRLLRWKLIWRVQLPAAYVGSLFSSALLASGAGALAAPLLGAQPLALAGMTLAGWFALESLMCAIKGWPLSLRSPLAFVTREVLDLLVWARALTTSEVAWAGVQYRSSKNGRAHGLAPAGGGR